MAKNEIIISRPIQVSIKAYEYLTKIKGGRIKKLSTRTYYQNIIDDAIPILEKNNFK